MQRHGSIVEKLGVVEERSAPSRQIATGGEVQSVNVALPSSHVNATQSPVDCCLLQ